MANAGAPPSNEHFLLKDLDTGMKSYVTDQEWVEKPVVPPALLSMYPSSSLNQLATKKAEAPSADMSSSATVSQPAVPSTSATIAPTRPPLHPHAASGRPGRSVQKRARSDELRAAHLTLRPSDHVRVLSHKKRERDFNHLYRWQRIHAHHGAIRVLEFNISGEWLATAGADAFVKIWHVDCNLEDSHTVPTTEMETAESSHGTNDAPKPRAHSGYIYLRKGAPALTCRGHTSDVTDLSWSKNDFLLSASLDGSIRLWHPRAKTCLRLLLHTDMVTSVAFHPTDEQICIAGTSDGVIHMWHLKERKILSQADTDDLITATAITPDGTTALIGTLHGRCKFYALFDEIQAEWQFKHTTQLDVRSRRARNATGKKICGFRFYEKGDKVLVSSNDSRMRLYRLDDKSVVCKFVGNVNSQARLHGSFDPSGRYVLCASEERKIYIWDLQTGTGDIMNEPRQLADGNDHFSSTSSATATASATTAAAAASQRKDVGIAHESFVVQDSGQVTSAVFAPRCVPEDVMKSSAAFSSRTSGIVIVTASDDGHIRVFGCC